MSIEALPLARKASGPAPRNILLAGLFVLLVQGTLTVSLARPEYLPSPPPLSGFNSAIGPWLETGSSNMDPAVYELLAPDDYLNRNYADPARNSQVNLFIAYYKTQYKAKSAHDPKVCLPGAGFNPITSKTIEIPTSLGNVAANYYLIAKDSAKSVVVYWYQTYDRALTGDQGLHLSRFFEIFTTNRTDMALVRVVVPVNNEDVAGASGEATRFVQAAYGGIMRQFPASPIAH